jgi:hypothetical protein
MRMVFLALLLAAVSVLRPQGQQQTLQGLPEYGVLLTGSPEVPVIVNHSGRTIIGFSMSTYMVNGGRAQAASLLLVYSRSAAVADGAQYQPRGLQIPAVATRPTLLPIVKAVLDSILFDNGEYVGADFATARLDTIREIGRQLTAVKYGSDAEIAAVWSKLEEMVPWRHDPSTRIHALALDPDRYSAALNLLRERDLHGERLAFDLAEYYSSLPVPWRSRKP